MSEFLNYVYAGNPVKSYLVFLFSLSVCLLAAVILHRFVRSRLSTWIRVPETSATVEKLLDRYLFPLLLLCILYGNLRLLSLHAALLKILTVAMAAAGFLLGAAFTSALLVLLLNTYWSKKRENADRYAARWIGGVIKFLVWAVALLLFLDNVGVKISTLIAGLGIGGIAVAFAAQTILEDLFSFVTIFFDRPFELGDFIVVDELMGTVEHIGIKTTRLRSIDGEQLIFSNKDLTGSRLRNYKRMRSRRVLFQIGVPFDTPVERLREIPGLMKTVIGGVAGTRFDRAHFFEYDKSSLSFEVVYYVQSQDYNVYMDVRQEINLRIKEEFDRRGIRFAYPTQALYVHGGAQDAQKPKFL